MTISLASGGSSSSKTIAQVPSELPQTNSSASWYAIFTRPQNEKSTARHLLLRELECFLPLHETVRRWKNRQKVCLSLPLFPCYLFVRISARERGHVLSTPGVLKIVGNGRGPIPVPDATMDFLRSDYGTKHLEPFHELAVGARVRITAGAMRGLQGTLVRKNNNFRFVLTIEPVNLHAAVEIDLQDLEAI
jgi:transcription antitermination factor NusG